MDRKLCWICQKNPADSGEHKFKRTDLVKAYKGGPLIHVREGVETRIQGPSSDKWKHAKSLCHDCNSRKSQPWDRSYSTFRDWFFDNEAQVLKYRFIDLTDVYGSDFETKQRDLYKYFAKIFGCIIVDACNDVPRDINELLLSSDQFLTHLRLTFSVNDDLLELLPSDAQRGYAAIGTLWTTLRDRKTFSLMTSIAWLNTHYWYNWVPDGSLGSTWVADSQFIYLGSWRKAKDNIHIRDLVSIEELNRGKDRIEDKNQ